MAKGKSTNSLMIHMRNNHNIDVAGSTDKKNLLNIGYYHGYKGYRFIKDKSNSINNDNFHQVMAIYTFDAKLKSLFYTL